MVLEAVAVGVAELTVSSTQASVKKEDGVPRKLQQYSEAAHPA
jgi:hypothetical protein